MTGQGSFANLLPSAILLVAFLRYYSFESFDLIVRVLMLRPLCLAFLLATYPINTWSEVPDFSTLDVRTWTMTSGKTMEGSLVSSDGDRVTMLVRNTIPVAALDAPSKFRISALSELTDKELKKRPLTPESWTSASGKVVSAVFESARGGKVSLLVSKEIPLSELSDASRLQLQVMMDDDEVPAMDLSGIDVPELSLTMEPSVAIDLSTEPDILVDMKNDSSVLEKLNKYVRDDVPSEPTASQASAESDAGPTPAELAAAARQKRLALSNQRIAAFMKEFKALYSSRGDAEVAEESWKKRYEEFLARIDQVRKLEPDDLIAYSSLALAAAALERRDERAIVSSLLMLSEFLIASR